MSAVVSKSVWIIHAYMWVERLSELSLRLTGSGSVLSQTFRRVLAEHKDGKGKVIKQKEMNV